MEQEEEEEEGIMWHSDMYTLDNVNTTKKYIRLQLALQQAFP